MLQLCKENEDRIIYSENVNFLKNVSNALSCKKNKTPKTSILNLTERSRQ